MRTRGRQGRFAALLREVFEGWHLTGFSRELALASDDVPAAAQCQACARTSGEQFQCFLSRADGAPSLDGSVGNAQRLPSRGRPAHVKLGCSTSIYNNTANITRDNMIRIADHMLSSWNIVPMDIDRPRPIAQQRAHLDGILRKDLAAIETRA